MTTQVKDHLAGLLDDRSNCDGLERGEKRKGRANKQINTNTGSGETNTLLSTQGSPSDRAQR